MNEFDGKRNRRRTMVNRREYWIEPIPESVRSSFRSYSEFEYCDEEDESDEPVYNLESVCIIIRKLLELQGDDISILRLLFTYPEMTNSSLGRTIGKNADYVKTAKQRIQRTHPELYNAFQVLKNPATTEAVTEMFLYNQFI